MSLAWNYAAHCEHDLLGAYGTEPDAVRIDYYRRLWSTTDVDGS